MNTHTPEELRELDSWIAETLFGFAWVPGVPERGYSYYLISAEDHKDYAPEFVKRGIYVEGGVFPKRVPFYTTDPADAMQVLEKCAEKSRDVAISHSKADSRLRTEGGVKEWCLASVGVVAEADTLPLAICLFARKLFSK